MKGASKLIEFNGEQYVTVSEVARRLKISHVTCSANVVPSLTACYLPGRRRTAYKLSEVEQLFQVRTIEKHVQPLAPVREEAS